MMKTLICNICEKHYVSLSGIFKQETFICDVCQMGGWKPSNISRAKTEKAEILKKMFNQEGKIKVGKLGFIMCMNSDCVNYYEDSCMINLSHDIVHLDDLGTCTDFVAGVNEGYLQDEENSDD